MYINRLIPCLLIKNQDLVKTIKFGKERYLGDPINAVKIFNDREADELIILDITATKDRRSPDFAYLKKITQQCFMPTCYGGGVTCFADVKRLFEIGFEKVSINTTLFKNPELIVSLAREFGSQSIVGAMDIKRNKVGSYDVWIHDGKYNTHLNPVEYAKRAENLGVGELFINYIDNDGMMNGMDYASITEISNTVAVPVIVCGGVGQLHDCADAIKHGASAVACGSLFSFWGRNKAVLINYPDEGTLKKLQIK